MNLAADDTTPGLRRAALALHALSKVDRVWVMGQLTGSQRQALHPLMAELVELGIPPDAQVVRRVLSDKVDPPMAAGQASVPDTAALCRAVRSEPAAMQPYLLAVLSPTQRDAVLAQGEGPTPPALLTLLPTALRESLLRALCERALSLSEA